MITNNLPPAHLLRRIKSFVRRDSRLTAAQKRVLTEMWPQCGIDLSEGFIDWNNYFTTTAPLTLEIGFGSGQSLLKLASLHPEQNFVGIETYQPGIGALLLGIEALQLTNIRIIYADAVEVLTRHVAAHSIDTLQIFFPDPWTKRKHHKRRLIQPEFVKLAHLKLKPQGLLHLATDWEHYAAYMLAVVKASNLYHNLAKDQAYAERSAGRPIITKFEHRAERQGRLIRELQFVAQTQ